MFEVLYGGWQACGVGGVYGQDDSRRVTRRMVC